MPHFATTSGRGDPTILAVDQFQFDAAQHALGVRGPIPWISATQSAEIATHIRTTALMTPGLIDRPKGAIYWKQLGSGFAWYKSLHQYVDVVREIATSSAITTEVRAIIGNHLSLWGSQWVQKAPGESHRWHADVECLDSKGVTVWLALKNSGPRSGLKLIPGSHSYPKYPQEIHAGTAVDLQDDAQVLAAARSFAESARIESPTVLPGSFLVFQGKTWHASFNETLEARVALILQYSPVGTRLRIPVTFEPPLRWHTLQPFMLYV